ncbi:MAG: 50S ribosomal protein L17 [Bacteroidaceae bacterium]|nr:50S ribosomal protein L17 [Bacteroidaceae bacterium]
MRHNKKFNHLGRTSSHRSAMLSNMACSLFKHKRITTTVAKAKALKKFVEPLITKSKDDTTNSRRVVFSNLQDKMAVTVLFKEISAKVADRPGGYTRVIKLGKRDSDDASMCFIELVDYDDNMAKDKVVKKASRTRRSKAKVVRDSVVSEVKEEVAESAVDVVATPVDEPKADESTEKVDDAAK